jgi:hypothetical protein
MDERQFWLETRRAALTVVRAIEARYGRGPQDPAQLAPRASWLAWRYEGKVSIAARATPSTADRSTVFPLRYNNAARGYICRWSGMYVPSQLWAVSKAWRA